MGGRRRSRWTKEIAAGSLGEGSVRALRVRVIPKNVPEMTL
jgi:hypothetical protein